MRKYFIALLVTVHTLSMFAGEARAVTEAMSASYPDNVVDTIPVGADPIGLALTPDGGTLYVSNWADGTISVLRTSDNEVVETIYLAPDDGPHSTAITPDGQYLYVPCAGYGSQKYIVRVISTETNSIVGDPITVGREPNDVAIDPDGTYAYVSNSANCTFSVIDLRTNTVAQTVNVTGNGPWAVEVNPQGDRLYVREGAHGERDTVAVFDTATLGMIDRIDVGFYSGGIVFSPDGQFAYVSNCSDRTISVVRTSDNSVTNTIELPAAGWGPQALAVTPDGEYLYAAGSYASTSPIETGNKVFVIDTATHEIIREIEVGELPYALAVNGQGTRVYVANELDDTVSVIGLPGTGEMQWTDGPPLSTERGGACAAVLEGKLYLIGGGRQPATDSASTMVEVFDPVTDTWTLGTPLQTERTMAGCAVVGGKIYVIGGTNASGMLTSVEEYDPITGAWTYKAPMPSNEPPRGAACAAVGGRIYVFLVYHTYVYDVSTDTWTSGTPMPRVRSDVRAAQFGSGIYLVGGFFSGWKDYVDVYYPGTDTWETRAALPSPRGHVVLTVLADRLYAISGLGTEPDANVTVEYYDGELDVWTRDTSLDTGRYLAAGATIEQEIIVCGGYYPATTSVEIGTLAEAEPPVAEFSGAPTSGVEPLEVQFIDLSMGEITSWWWNFGDGGASTEQNPSHIYEGAGYFTVSLTVSGPGGSDTETKTNYVHVAEAAPVAAFSAIPTSGHRPLTVQFADESTGEITSWSWDFGDGGTSTQQDPSHTYDATGYFTVSLTVSGPGGSDTETKTNHIHVTEPAPVAGFSASPRSGTTPLEVEFADESMGVVTSWSWDFGDGGTSTARNPSHTYNSTGYFTVRLTVSGPGGSDTETKASYIHVTGAAPVADFTASPTSGNIPLTVLFTDQSTATVTGWSWSFGDGSSSTEQNPSHTYRSAGRLTVSLTVASPGGSDTETKTNYISVWSKEDIDQDGDVDEDDARIILDVAVGLTSRTGCDLNSDGRVNAMDAIVCLKAAH